MNIGFCPSCGSRRVRLGRTFLSHLSRMAQGSQRRYCLDCRARWKSLKLLFSPGFRLAENITVTAAAIGLFAWWIMTVCGMTETRHRRLNPVLRGGNTARTDGALSQRDSQGEIYRYSTYAAAKIPGRNGLPRGQETAYEREYGRQAQNMGQSGGLDQISRKLMQLLMSMVQTTGKSPRQIAAEIDATSKE